MKVISRIGICLRLIKISLTIIFFLSATLLFISCNKKSDAQNDEAYVLSQEELIARGKSLVSTSACHDCHSPKILTPSGAVLDTTRLLSGHPGTNKLPGIPVNSSEWLLFSPDLTAFVGPWGVSYAANLTPDETGIQAWTFENFKTAIRKGKYKGQEGGRSLLPPMPWEQYRSMNDRDLSAIFAYLKSLKPINNLVPPPISPEDLNSIKPVDWKINVN